MKYHTFLRRIATIILLVFLPVCAMAAEKVEYRVPDLRRYADLSMGAKHREMDNYFRYSYNGYRSGTLDMMEDFAQLLIDEYGFICCGSEFLGQDEEAKVIWLEHFDPAVESFSLSEKEAGTKIDECDICLIYEKNGRLYDVVFLMTKNLILTDMGERSASIPRVGGGVVSIGDLRVGEYRNYDKLLPISEQEKTADHSSSDFGSGNLGFDIDFDSIGSDSGFGYGDFGFDIDFDAIGRDSGFGDGSFDIDFDAVEEGSTTKKPRDCGLCNAGYCRNCKGMGYTINPYTGDKNPCNKFCSACNGEGIIY